MSGTPEGDAAASTTADRGDACAMSRTRPPMPPPELRLLVGGVGDEHYENPTGERLWGLPREAFDFVLDWGCGCGRIARKLLLQDPPPRRYLGFDLHRGMVRWCREHLAPCAPGFDFVHQDVRNVGLNPQGEHDVLPLPVTNHTVSLFVAVSVFTHVLEPAATFYLGELARVLRPGGVAVTSWFLFDKADFPMMQESQNALFVNAVDPTNAVIYDREWLRRTLREKELAIWRVEQPEVRGFQWRLFLAPLGERPEVELPADSAQPGIRRSPQLPAGAAELGVHDDLASDGAAAD
ncbi:MAG TPA: class I SAM-dependent methyltransferase [Thermoanaerobaculia bacterium]|nr:class I SAM-dependent methyltransferase [Thermoanaerobaculia bacterium]